MQKQSLSLGLATAMLIAAGPSFAVENEVIMDFAGQANNLPLYTSATGLGTMTVSPPGVGGFSVPSGHTAFVTTPGAGGITTVFTPSSTAVPTRIAIYDQRASTYRNITAKCLNPNTLAIEPCDFGNTALFPRTNTPPSAAPYTQATVFNWYGDPFYTLQPYTPGSGNIQSNGGYVTLPPYVREITVTAYGGGNADFSGTDIYMADPPSVSKAFAPAALNPGGQTTLTISIKNPGLGAPIPGVSVIDSLPTPLKIVSASHTCTDGSLTAAAGSTSLSLTGATLPTAGCEITAVLEWPNDTASISACVATPTVTNRITPPAQFSTAIGQLNTEAVADLSCSYTPPVVSVACTPSELFDSPNQQSVCTITSSTPAGSSGLNVNLTPPAANTRYTSDCSTSVTIPAAQTSAQCMITATANTVAGDGDVTATLAIAAPSNTNDYTIGVTPAQVVIKNDDESGGTTAKAVPTLGDWSLILMGSMIALLGVARLGRREI
ncbi:putative repeat protein (TIGR01451 family) [Comamonas sp. BIGb0152]|uniref:IPTL-CTERM sorting domain-containing protein n=1 Tax=Comamonas sp. BIGb0152 TaxID=2940601 RepID=UPI00216877CA|nr:IPTL-CTERM sorting domain-containing protein [Comamonas sp. BIGb0152]MCS4292726.1 putative repeat protein (TIGR01451 family) [Comamonas sp. BIGb0152]